MSGVNVDRMRRYAYRAEQETAEQEHRRWLAGLTPEHRARHESGPLVICGECVNRGLAMFQQRVEELSNKRSA